MSPPAGPPRTIGDPLAWLGESRAALAELAFGAGRKGDASRSHGRHLALLSADALELDLSDPAQRELGEYELVELLGEGGMGVVYRAHQASLDRDVAIKLLAAGPWASREFVERFRREAQNAARMQHPNIVAIHEIGTIDELHFFSMQLVRGTSLAAALRTEGPMDARRAARLVRTVAEAVAYAHSLGVLHLDLKPANVLLDTDRVPHVADFGLARRIDVASAETAEVSGTPNYMAPEQAEGRTQEITSATDIWGLGAVLYEAVTGAAPFEAASVRDTLKLVVAGELKRPRLLQPALPRDLEAIILRCLEHAPEHRYASARELADDLGRFVEDRAVRARPLNAPERVVRWFRREPRFAGAVALTALALVAGLTMTTLQWRRADANAARANENAAHAEAARRLLVGVFDEALPDVHKGQPFTARDLLEKGEKVLATAAPGDPAIRADLTGLLGRLYWSIGDYERARPLLERAVATDAPVPDGVMARNLLGLARAQKEKNQYAAAIATATRALALAARNGGDSAEDASEIRRVLADAEIGSGDAAAAETRLRAALDTDRRLFGDAGAAVADDEQMLGYALLELSRLDEAAAMARSAIDAESAIHGRRSSPVLASLADLAIALRTSGKFGEAESVLREAVSISTEIYGADHHDTLSARSNLLLALESQGRFEEALAGRLAMLDAQRKLAIERPDVLAYAYKNIAGDYHGLGRFAEAETNARAALDAWEKIEGSEDEWHSIAARNLLGSALAMQGKYADAEAVLRKSAEIAKKHEPPASVWLNGTYGSLADVLRLAGRPGEARALVDQALNALPGKPTPTRAGLLARLAELQIESGDAAAAVDTATRSLAMARAVLPERNLQLGQPLLALGNAMLAAGRADQAEPLLREALAVRSPPCPAGDPRVLEVEVPLERALLQLGRVEEARALQRRVDPLLHSLGTPYAMRLLARSDAGFTADAR
ncbi:MAG TPA: serine/threonine-protein kinase [Rhodanobacteraceae bacterium]|nr:serine/threonine-protein kinase [Rhodanobacteraceae bacterium]